MVLGSVSEGPGLTRGDWCRHSSMSNSFFDKMKRDAAGLLKELNEAAKDPPDWAGLLTAALEDGAASLETLSDPDEIGERVRAEIEDLYVVDQGESHDRVRRVAAALNAQRDGRPLETVVVWGSVANAAAAPGRYIYISKELEQNLRTDAHVAFVLAHEMAHVDLGHLAPSHASNALGRLPDQVPVRVAVGLARRISARPEIEYEADAHGLALCLAAGFDADDCIEVFQILERLLLDQRDLDGVFGSMPDPEGMPWANDVREWWRQRVTGYAPLRDRAERLRIHR